MAWQEEAGSGSRRAINSDTQTGSNTKYDWLAKLVYFACSQHIATVAINAGGSTYSVGDTVNLNVTAFDDAENFEAEFEVTTVSAGVVTGLRINKNGAYSTRAYSPVLVAGGSNYSVGDILQVNGGTWRKPVKIRVTGVSGGAVTTFVVHESINPDSGANECSGIYSVKPTGTLTTTLIGPSGGTGSGCTLTLSWRDIPAALTALATTSSGSGTGLTVDVTLAETGWSVDTRDWNNYDEGPDTSGSEDVTTQKQVTLVGDASGFTNKPYVHLHTGQTDVGVPMREWVQLAGSVAHNSGADISGQAGLTSDFAYSGFSADGGSFLCFAEDNAGDVDIWFSVDDQRIFAVINTNSTTSTDSGRYQQLYAGYLERFKTETEDPYPMAIFASSRDRDADETTSSTFITSIAESYGTTGSSPGQYYRGEAAAWTQWFNLETSTYTTENDIVWPMGTHWVSAQSTSPSRTTIDTPDLQFINQVIEGRSASTKILRNVPGTTDLPLLYPLTLIRHTSGDPNNTDHGVRGTFAGLFWVYNDDGSGNKITNFSEDYITVGSDRYRIFHNHVHTDRAQFIAVLENV